MLRGAPQIDDNQCVLSGCYSMVSATVISQPVILAAAIYLHQHLAHCASRLRDTITELNTNVFVSSLSQSTFFFNGLNVV